MKFRTAHIWRGETLYPQAQLPLTIDKVLNEYGFVLGGIPLVYITNPDGQTTEIHSLSNWVHQYVKEFPDDYKQWAVSPIKFRIDADNKVQYTLEDTNPKLLSCIKAAMDYIEEQHRWEAQLADRRAAIAAIGWEKANEETIKEYQDKMRSLYAPIKKREPLKLTHDTDTAN